LENQDGLLGHQPTGVISKQLAINATIESSCPRSTEQGAGKRGHQDRNQGRKASAQIRARRVENQGSNSGEYPEQEGSQDRPDSTAPKEKVPYVYITGCGLVH